MKINRIATICILLITVLLAGCSKGQVMDGEDMIKKMEYTHIDQETAKDMMAQDDGHIIVDVRTQEEYATGHIPGAVCIPNESIAAQQPEELPDLEQVIIVYCRSGRRSKEAAQKLADIGYANVYEFGGIIDWTGDIVTEDAVTEADNTENPADAIRPVPVLVIEAGEKTFYADLEDNSSADAFAEKLSSGPITVDMHDYGNFEKVGDLPWELPENDMSITTGPGDVILYQGDKITIYYDQNTWDFTRLANISGVTREELLEAFGEGDVSVTFSVEWSE